jgi:hypothetical protein
LDKKHFDSDSDDPIYVACNAIDAIMVADGREKDESDESIVEWVKMLGPYGVYAAPNISLLSVEEWRERRISRIKRRAEMTSQYPQSTSE